MPKPAEANGISSVQSLKVNIQGSRTFLPSAATAAAVRIAAARFLRLKRLLKVTRGLIDALEACT